MKITLRPPCAECPFLKKSAPGWLGSDTPEAVWGQVHSDGQFGYPCHMDVDKIKGEADLTDPDSVEQCVGALVHASKTAKSYSDKWREAARGALAKLVPADAILGMDFMQHHKTALKGKRR